jgi:hypothetical protein
MGEWENDLKNLSLACFGETQNPIKKIISHIEKK